MDKPKAIIVNGGYRTGSTLAYNVVKELLRVTGKPGVILGLFSRPD